MILILMISIQHRIKRRATIAIAIAIDLYGGRMEFEVVEVC
jgi:hypothetical protein